MSEGGPRRIAVVCEGPSDRWVIGAALDYLLGDEDYVLQVLQPEESDFAGLGEAAMGRGWKGVRNWCRKRLGDFVARDAALLIVHCDGEVAGEAEISCQLPCPPASASVDALRDIIAEWSGCPAEPCQYVFCIPAQTTEAWVVAAVFPQHPELGPEFECRPKPETLLIEQQYRLVRRKDGALKKNVRAYERVAPLIARRWTRVCQICTQAERFTQDLAAAVSD